MDANLDRVDDGAKQVNELGRVVERGSSSEDLDSLLYQSDFSSGQEFQSVRTGRIKAPEQVARELIDHGLADLVKFLGLKEEHSAPVLRALSAERHPMADQLFLQSVLLSPWTFDLSHGAESYRARAAIKSQSIAAGLVIFHDCLIRKDPALADELIGYYRDLSRKRESNDIAALSTKIRSFYLAEVGGGLSIVRTLLGELSRGKCDTASTNLLRGILAPFVELSPNLPQAGFWARIFSPGIPRYLSVLFDREMSAVDGEFFRKVDYAIEQADICDALGDERFADPHLLRIREIRGKTERMAALDSYLSSKPSPALSLAELHVILDAIPNGAKSGKENSFATLKQLGQFAIPNQLDGFSNTKLEPDDIRISMIAISRTRIGDGQRLVNLISKKLDRILTSSTVKSYDTEHHIEFYKHLSRFMREQLGKAFARCIDSPR